MFWGIRGDAGMAAYKGRGVARAKAGIGAPKKAAPRGAAGMPKPGPNVKPFTGSGTGRGGVAKSAAKAVKHFGAIKAARKSG